MVLEGSRHDRGIYNDSQPVLEPIRFFEEDEKVIADSGFQGEGEAYNLPPERKPEQELAT